MALKSTHEPTVPLAELLGSVMDVETARAYGAVAGVEVLVDFLDRPAVTLADAYRLAEQRREADREYQQAQSRARVEHAAAVRDLGERMNAAFVRARDEAMARMAGEPRFEGPRETRAEAVVEGLGAARMLWAAAPELVRQEVMHVEALEGDVLTSFELGIVMPRPIQDRYIHRAAAKA